MIRKPFELNKERLRKDFMSPKYENRRKEFFATYSEYLRNYVRDEYYEFMNDIQTEVNFFEWFDHYFKPKILAGRNTNTNLLLRDKSTSQSHAISNTPPNNHTQKISNILPTTQISNILPTTPNTKDKNTNHEACKISNTLVNKTYPYEVFDKPLTPKQQITDNISFTSLLVKKYGQINTIKKKDKTNKDTKKLKKKKKTKEKVTNHKPICYKMQ
jgi:hypothetical protein